MDLSYSIRQALLTLLREKLIVASWGISDICIGKSHIYFTVDGFKYKGTVIIYESDNGYTVIMSNHYLFCKLDSLIYKLDEFIEKSTDYENRIEDLLNEV